MVPQGSFEKAFKVLLPPFLAELEHRSLDFSADLDPLRVRRLGLECSCLHRTREQVCTLVAAYFDECGLPGLFTDNAPVPAGEVGLARDLVEATAAVGPPPKALLFEFIDRDPLVASLGTR